MTIEGWHGWSEYAPFYDWENARTVGRRDVAFWRAVVTRERGPVLELGCGTGRLLMPLARAGADMLGLDRSPAMLERARARARRLSRRLRPSITRGDVRALPFRRGSVGVVMAPYGLLQSVLTDRDLDRTLAEAVRVLRRGGLLAIDLVPELPAWAESGPRVSLRGARGGATVTLVESVRQDRRRKLTIFDEAFTERRGRSVRSHRFQLVFRTQPMPVMLARVESAGLRVDAVLGDYRGGPWHAQADAWVILARKQ